MTTQTQSPAEFVAYLDSVAPADADVLRTIQHAEGFRANCAGVDFQEFRPVAWQDGWLDANDLGTVAPIEYFRLSAEA